MRAACSTGTYKLWGSFYAAWKRYSSTHLVGYDFSAKPCLAARIRQAGAKFDGRPLQIGDYVCRKSDWSTKVGLLKHVDKHNTALVHYIHYNCYLDEEFCPLSDLERAIATCSIESTSLEVPIFSGSLEEATEKLYSSVREAVLKFIFQETSGTPPPLPACLVLYHDSRSQIDGPRPAGWAMNAKKKAKRKVEVRCLRSNVEMILPRKQVRPIPTNVMKKLQAFWAELGCRRPSLPLAEAFLPTDEAIEVKHCHTLSIHWPSDLLLPFKDKVFILGLPRYFRRPLKAICQQHHEIRLLELADGRGWVADWIRPAQIGEYVCRKSDSTKVGLLKDVDASSNAQIHYTCGLHETSPLADLKRAVATFRVSSPRLQVPVFSGSPEEAAQKLHVSIREAVLEFITGERRQPNPGELVCCHDVNQTGPGQVGWAIVNGYIKEGNAVVQCLRSGVETDMPRAQVWPMGQKRRHALTNFWQQLGRQQPNFSSAEAFLSQYEAIEVNQCRTVSLHWPNDLVPPCLPDIGVRLPVACGELEALSQQHHEIRLLKLADGRGWVPDWPNSFQAALCRFAKADETFENLRYLRKACVQSLLDFRRATSELKSLKAIEDALSSHVATAYSRSFSFTPADYGERGGFPYFKPCGWRRTARAATKEFLQEWPVAYHGTSLERAVLIFAEKFIWDPAYVHGNRHGQAQCGWTSHAVHDAQATDGCSGEPFFRFYK
ncbi:unnamed protein product [Effrenium voratum]|nr:unnamed protein product [Effrenium voratum]